MTDPKNEEPAGSAAAPQEKTLDTAIVADGDRCDKPEAPPSEHAPSADAEREATARLIALAAIAGFELCRLDGGALQLSRWNLCRHLPDADAARAFLASAGVRT